jgi:hypothetical protein
VLRVPDEISFHPFVSCHVNVCVIIFAGSESTSACVICNLNEMVTLVLGRSSWRQLRNQHLVSGFEVDGKVFVIGLRKLLTRILSGLNHQIFMESWSMLPLAILIGVCLVIC